MAYTLEQISDHIEIRDLCARHNRYANLAEGKNYTMLYAEDGEFCIVGNRVYRGSKEIAATCEATRVTVHVTSDPLIEIDADTARRRSRAILFYRSPDSEKSDFITTVWCIAELERMAQGWRVCRRRAEIDLTFDQALCKMSVTEGFEALPASLDGVELRPPWHDPRQRTDRSSDVLDTTLHDPGRAFSEGQFLRRAATT